MPEKGYVQTLEHRQKGAIARKGRIGKYARTEEIREKLRQFNTGRKASSETKMKLSSMRVGIKKSPTHVAKVAEANRNRSPEVKEKIRSIMAFHNKQLGECHKGCNNPNWKGENRIPISFFAKRRRVRKSNCLGSHSYPEWLSLKQYFSFTCPSCGRSEPEINLHKDHIIPLAKGGSDFIGNIQPLCRTCNLKKQTKIISYTKWGENLYG